MDRRMGARRRAGHRDRRGGQVQQAADPDDGSSWSGGRGRRGARPSTTCSRRARSGRPGRRAARGRGAGPVTDARPERRPRSPRSTCATRWPPGSSTSTEGRLPPRPDEVVVNHDARLAGSAHRRRARARRRRAAARRRRRRRVDVAPRLPGRGGPLGSLGRADRGTAPDPLAGRRPGRSRGRRAGAQRRRGVRRLARRCSPTRRRTSELPPRSQSYDTGIDEAYLAILVLIVTMALLEVVLLAGPAFAVSARRQPRTLALIAASGGTPPQARRVVLASGVVLGGVAAVLGVLLGIGAARGRRADRPAAPAARGSGRSRCRGCTSPASRRFGLLSALLAAVVPACIASRQDVVAVLAGPPRRPAPSLRSPGARGAAARRRHRRRRRTAPPRSSGEILIAVSRDRAAVLGMILLVPVVVVLARPALAAAAAACCGTPSATPPGTAPAPCRRSRPWPRPSPAWSRSASAGQQRRGGERRALHADLSMGTGVVTLSDQAAGRADAARAAGHGGHPRCRRDRAPGGARVGRRRERCVLVVPGPRQDAMLVQSYGSTLGSSVLVSDGDLAAVAADVPAGDRERAAAALAAGGVVAFTDRPLEATAAVVVVESYSPEGETVGSKRVRVPAAFLTPRLVRGRAAGGRRAGRGRRPRRSGAAGGHAGVRHRDHQGRAARRSGGAPGSRGGRRRSTSSAATRRRRDRRDPAGAGCARCGADARRHPDRHVPRAVRRPARPGHARRRSAPRRGCGAASRRRTPWWSGVSVRCSGPRSGFIPGIAITLSADQRLVVRAEHRRGRIPGHPVAADPGAGGGAAAADRGCSSVLLARSRLPLVARLD